MERITESYAESMRQLGARRDAGQQHWEADMSFLVAGNLCYFAALLLLSAFMQRRPPYNPSLVMQLYNVRYFAGAGAPRDAPCESFRTLQNQRCHAAGICSRGSPATRSHAEAVARSRRDTS